MTKKFYGYDAVRKYTIPSDLLKEGINSIVFRVEDLGGGGGFGGRSNSMALYTANNKYELAGNLKRKIGAESVNISYSPNDIPTQLYNAMIHPLINFGVKGVIWYQGEANVNRAQQYEEIFPAMIESWRTAWKKPNLPFYFTQLANFMQPSAMLG